MELRNAIWVKKPVRGREKKKKVYSRIVGALAGSEVALEGPRKAPLWRDPQKQVFEKRTKDRNRENSRGGGAPSCSE